MPEVPEDERREWMLTELSRYVELAGKRKNAWSGHGPWQTLDDELNDQLGVVIPILRRLIPGWTIPKGLSIVDYGEYGVLRPIVVVEITKLERREELQRYLGDAPSPRIRADELHPWVWTAARTFWESEHRREAVRSAAAAINAQLQKKVDRRDLTDAALIRECFGMKEPLAGKPRLRFVEVQPGTDDWTSRHQGALEFGAGRMLAIRNIATHADPEIEWAEQEALEKLAALSVLARWVDEAVVVGAADN
jgi:hypothetical protein